MPATELQEPVDVVTSTQTEVVSLETPLEEPVIVTWYAPAVVVAVVAAVSVEVCAESSVKVSDVGDTLQVVGLVALDGEVVMAQESETVPVNVLDGVTVMVEVLSVVAPGATVMEPLFERLKSPLPVVPLGACQKSPQPANSGTTASRNLAQLPIFIAAPCFSPDEFRSKGNASECVLSRCGIRRKSAAHGPCVKRRATAGVRSGLSPVRFAVGFRIPWAILIR